MDVGYITGRHSPLNTRAECCTCGFRLRIMTQQSTDSGSATLGKRTIADALRSLASWLHCPVSKLEHPHCVAVARQDSAERTVHVFERAGAGVVSLPSPDDRDFDLEHDEVATLIDLARGTMESGEQIALRNARLLVTDEPASLALLDHDTLITPTSRLAVSLVYDPRPSAMDMLRHELSPEDWEAGGGLHESPHRVGVLVGGTLVALASVSVGEGHLARTRVVVAPGFRRRGFGRLVLHKLANHVLSEGLLPYCRLAAANIGARALASAVGFVHFAHTVSLVATSVSDRDPAPFVTTPHFA